MTGKRAATKSVGASSASQPSILSFFGKGSSTTAKPTMAAGKKKNGPKPRKNKAAPAAARYASAADPEDSGTVSASSTPAAKKRKKEGAAAKAVDLTKATPPPRQQEQEAVPGATAAAADAMPSEPPRGSSPPLRKTAAPRGKSASPRAAAAAAATPRATTERAFGRATARGAGAAESEPDTPSPKTDSENSPSTLPSKRADNKGGDDEAARGRTRAKRSRHGRGAASSGEKEASGGGGGVGGEEEEEDDQPGRGRKGRSRRGENNETATSLPGGGDVSGEEEEEEEGEGGDETDGDEEGSGYEGGPNHTGAEAEIEDEDDDGLQQADGGISQYELQRLERIKRNQAFIATLGLDTAKPPVPPSLAASSAGAAGASKGRSKKRSRPVSRAKEKAPAVPVRRSARARGAEAVDYNEDKQAASAITTAARAAATRAPEPEPVLEEIDFDDSTVLKYLCGGGKNNDASDGEALSSSSSPAPEAAASAVAEGAKVVGLRVLEPDDALAAAGLSTIYTMHFGGGGERGAPPLLAAGGKGGIVALFSTRRHQQSRPESRTDDSQEEEEEDERTLMNFKAHKGWVSAVRFLEGKGGGGGGGGSGACRLLSSANDSVVKLWDTSKQHRGLPRLLCTMDDLHPTRKGIFSMDSCGARVATGSKDTTVSLACLRPTGISCDRVLGDAGGSEAFHQKVVKGVSLRDDNTVASCGDDSNVRVSDLRSRPNFGVSHRLDGVHEGPCHTVRWHPFVDDMLMSAGLDSTIKLHDLRHLGAPLHVFRGHCPYALARPRSIHRPEFFFPAAVTGTGSGGDRGGVNILSCGERSEKLSMYDAGTGATVSRGVLGAEASALAVGGSGGWPKTSSGAGTVAAALPGGSVVLLEPVWGHG
eukprot:g11067.t1